MLARFERRESENELGLPCYGWVTHPLRDFYQHSYFVSKHPDHKGERCIFFSVLDLPLEID